MADDPLDARLHAAGERWRAAQTTASEVRTRPDRAVDVVHDIEAPAFARPLRGSRVWLAVGAVASVAAALVIAVSLGGKGREDRREPAAGGSPLVGTTWQLSSSDHVSGTSRDPGPARTDELGPQPVPPAILRIDDRGRVTGSDGCNSFESAVEINGDRLQFGHLARTQARCANREAAITAEAVDSVLMGTVHWSIDGDRLTLDKPPTGSLDYRAASTASPALVGTAWRLIRVDRGDGNPTLVRHAGSLQLEFGKDPQIGFDDGLNYHSGPAELGNGTLIVGRLATTLVGCSGGEVCAQAEFIGRVLRGKVRWSMLDDQLTIEKTGVGSLTYDRAALRETPAPSPSATRTR